MHDLVTRSQSQGLPPLLIGDMAMVRGGPLAQVIAATRMVWMWISGSGLPPPLSRQQLANPTPLDMVRADNRHVSRAFSAQQQTLLRLAASDSRVERIFVHPAIKQALCTQTTGSQLVTQNPPLVRPSGLICMSACSVLGVPGLPGAKTNPPGDGCDAELQSWFSGPTEVSSSSKPKPLPILPGRCQQAYCHLEPSNDPL